MTLRLFDEGQAFRTTQLDPPWLETGGGKIKRGADRHYDVADREEILRAVRAAPNWRPTLDAHLYCWVTDNFLLDGLWLVDRLGFRYVRTFAWLKGTADVDDEDPDEADLVSGLGQYARGVHELMLFCVRGAGMSPEVLKPNRSIKSAFVAPCPRGAGGKRIHSRKPDRAYELIEARSHGPYAEIFATRRRDGWVSSGNQIDAKST